MATTYATTTQVKAVMPDDTFGTTYDTLISDVIERVSRLIDLYTNRRPGAYAATTSTEYFDGSGCSELWVGELAVAPSSVSVATGGLVDDSTGTGGTYTAFNASDYLLWPYNAAAKGKPYLRLDIDLIRGTQASWYSFPKAVKIVGKFGYSTTPDPAIVDATITQTVRAFQRGKQGYRDTGAVTELAQLRYVKALDPDVQMKLNFLKDIEV